MTPQEYEAIFPDEYPTNWNGGTWPPAALRRRWRELYTAILTSANSQLSPPAQARTAAALADWALRLEVERDMGP